MLAPMVGATRTEQALRRHIPGVVATDPQVRQGPVVVDKLNMPMSEALGRWLAAEADLERA